MRIPLLILLATSTLSAAETDLRGYLETHCFDCHDSTTKKGGLDLEALPMQFDAAERLAVWAKAHDRIACWFIDTDYNEESFFVRHAYFLGANDPYSAPKTTLKADINAEALSTLNSDT